MKRILFFTVICFIFLSRQSVAQNENFKTDRITYKVYATGIRSSEEAAEVEQKFRQVKGIVKTNFKFKSAENITTLFVITIENQVETAATMEEDAKSAQTFTGISAATFKDLLLSWGYDIYDVKREVKSN